MFFWRKDHGKPKAPERQNSAGSDDPLRTVPFKGLSELIHLESTEHSDDDDARNDIDFLSSHPRPTGPKGAIPCEISISDHDSSSHHLPLDDDDDDDLDATEALLYEELRPWCKLWADEFLLAIRNKEFRFANVILEDHQVLAQVRYPFEQYRQLLYPLAYLAAVVNNDDGLELLENVYHIYPEAIGYAGCLPLHFAARSNAYTVDFLLSKYPEGAKHTDHVYQTALHIASQNQLECVPALVKAYPTAVQLADAKGFTPVHYAVQNRHCTVELVRDILGPCSLRCTTREWQRPLHLAVATPDLSIDVIRYLLDADPRSVEATTENFESPLHCAIPGNVELYRLLVQAFPKALHWTNHLDETPFDVAQRKGASEDILELLRE